MVNILKWCKEIALTTYNGIGVRPQALRQQLAYKNIYTKNGKHLVINFILGGWSKGFTLRLFFNEAHLSPVRKTNNEEPDYLLSHTSPTRVFIHCVYSNKEK